MKDEMRYEEDLEMDKRKSSLKWSLNHSKDKILNESKRLENEKMKLERKRVWLEKLTQEMNKKKKELDLVGNDAVLFVFSRTYIRSSFERLEKKFEIYDRDK
jgi:hypothetical protein